MIFCPPLNYTQNSYLFVLDILAIITPVINLYVIYCIIFRSTIQMSRYRWYLLLHQIVSAMVDILISIVTKPLLLLPFPMGFPEGFSKNWVFPTSHHMVIAVFFFIGTSLGVAVHLFSYRYLVSTGRTNFSWRHSTLMSLLYLLCIWASLTFIIFYEDPLPLLSRLNQEYSCVTDEITNHPQMMVYNPEKLAHFMCIPAAFFIVFGTILVLYLAYLTNENIKSNSKSVRTARLQKKLLRQLMYQIAVPLFIMVFPCFGVIYILTCQVFGFDVIGLFFLATISMYGSMGGIVLVTMNPHYNKFLLQYMRRVSRGPLVHVTSTGVVR